MAGGVSIGVGLSFAAVAQAVQRRPVAGGAAVALRAFALWWACMAAYLILYGTFTVMAAYGRLATDVFLSARVVTIPLLCVGVWGITSYLLYLYTGATWVFRAMAAFYTAVAALFFWASFTGSNEMLVQRWIITADDTSAVYRAVYFLVGLPPIAAAMAYLALLRKVDERGQRYRIVLVSGSIFMWVASGLAARIAAHDAAIFVTLVLFGALAAAASLLAYYPPRRLRTWLDETPDARANRRNMLWQRQQQRLSELL